MSEESRPSDWEWVKATEHCRAAAMFVRLQALAQRDVDQRNQQLSGTATFLLTQISETEFSIGKNGASDDCLFFRVLGDLKCISVSGVNGRNEVRYTVGLDSNGVCKFRRGDEVLDPWQVLKAALEPLFF
jgi:hypothetical protein